jgi:hypothetical protein
VNSAATPRRSHSVGWLAPMVVAAMLVVLTGCSSGGGMAPGPDGVAVSVATSGAAPRVVDRIRVTVGGAAVAATADPAGLWVALTAPPGGLNASPTAGSLLRVQPAGGMAGRWPIGGAPTALATAAGSVWVADGPGPGPQPALGANQVLQLNSGGKPVVSYPVAEPVDIVAAADAAVVASQQPDGVFLRRLSAGAASAPVRLAGADPTTGSTLAWCPADRLWAASFDPAAGRTHVQMFTAGRGGPLVDTRHDIALGVSGPTSLSCRPDGVAVLVSDLDRATLYAITAGATGAPQPAVISGEVALARGGGGDADRAWLVQAKPGPRMDRTGVEVLDVGGLAVGRAAVVPVGAGLSAAVGDWLWVLGPDPGDPSVKAVFRVASQ